MRPGIRLPTRRGLLARGALLVGAALGLAGIARGDAPAIAARGTGQAAAAVLRLRGRSWHLVSSDRRPGELPRPGDRMSMYGELLDEQTGQKVGEFYSACFCMAAPFGPGPLAAANVELHNLNLLDGAIVGMGSAGAEVNTYAIVGGTGRYRGAVGSYVARQRPLELGGDGTAEFYVS